MKTISDHILDIVQNSAEARATLIEIIVIEDIKKDIYVLEFIDNGCGMNQETLEKVTSPFFTTRNTRRVGLGIPLLKQKTSGASGSFEIMSDEGNGTRVKAIFKLSDIDRPPLGDLWTTLYLIFVSYPEIRIIYRHSTAEGTFEADSVELGQVLSGVSLQTGEIKRAVIDLVRNNLEDLKASK